MLFLDFDCFGKGGEVLAQYAQKGKQLFLSGRLVTESWDDKQSGQKRSKIKLNVETFQFLGGNRDGSGREGSASGSEPAKAEDDRFKDADIPF